MITIRLGYVIEKGGMLSPHQSGFRNGRTTMDPIICLENEIRKAQVSKEAVLVILFDTEKAYDMLWKEGLLIKLNKMGIGGRMFNWFQDFLNNRTIEVRVGMEFSSIYPIENGTPQGSVCSPMLFNIMINDIFNGIDQRMGRALWVRGRNIDNLKVKMQSAIVKVEKWSYEWGFHLSIEKTQFICFSKKRTSPTIDLKLYGQHLKQVDSIRYLGVWFDVKLNFKTHIQKIIDKCKKGINILKCLAGEHQACP